MLLYIIDFINPTHSTFLAATISDFLTNMDKLGTIGVFYLFFVFTMFFKDYEYIVNKIYETNSRAIYKLFFMYMGFLILLPILFFIFIFITTVTHFSFSIHIFAFIFIWIMFIILFILSANTKVSFYAATVSSLITLIILSITKRLFGYYVIANTTYTTIYGSFSVALFFFLWIYISWNIYLYGIKLCSIINKDNLKNVN
jgi:membrane protein